MVNQTKTEEILLLGFTESHQPEMLLFTLILVMYLMAIAGNILIVIITLLDVHLRTPMYYFLRNYAILEIGYTSAVIPKALINLALGKKTISYVGCISQLFFYFFLGTTDFFLLTVMSFDRYVAICSPLRYTTIMNQWTLAITTISYTVIISTILHIPTAAGRKKAFSTCASHIIVVSITYGSCISMYLIPEESEGKNFNNAVAILNNVVCPLMTPFVYTLRNKQVKDALKNALGCKRTTRKI
ncbi:olfactory receptor 6E1-like [Vipera latastei]